jgi:hypothetical protein
MKSEGNYSEAKQHFNNGSNIVLQNIILLLLLKCLIENVRAVFCPQFNSTIKLPQLQAIIRGGARGPIRVSRR